MPDLGLTTADDMVRNAAMLAGLDRDVPVIADADTGFGGPVMVERTVSSNDGVIWVAVPTIPASQRTSSADPRSSATSSRAWLPSTSRTR
jgi:hypothetical protein